jgi:histone deacetylase 4/5
LYVCEQVIDLTDRKGSEESEISKQQRDREQFLQQQRDLMMRHTLQVSEGKLQLLYVFAVKNG